MLRIASTSISLFSGSAYGTYLRLKSSSGYSLYRRDRRHTSEASMAPSINTSSVSAIKGTGRASEASRDYLK